MDRKQAVTILKRKTTIPGDGYTWEQINEAIDMAIAALSPPNEPLAQADLDSMDYDKVWIDYGDDGEWALVVSGRIYALAVLEGTGFEDILRDEVGGETMDRPTGDYTVYRRSPKAKDNNVPTNEPLTLEQLREMDGEPVYLIVDDQYEPLKMWALIEVVETANCVILTSNLGGRNEYYDNDEMKDDGVTAYRRPPEGEA